MVTGYNLSFYSVCTYTEMTFKSQDIHMISLSYYSMSPDPHLASFTTMKKRRTLSNYCLRLHILLCFIQEVNGMSFDGTRLNFEIETPFKFAKSSLTVDHKLLMATVSYNSSYM